MNWGLSNPLVHQSSSGIIYLILLAYKVKYYQLGIECKLVHLANCSTLVHTGLLSSLSLCMNNRNLLDMIKQGLPSVPALLALLKSSMRG